MVSIPLLPTKSDRGRFSESQNHRMREHLWALHTQGLSEPTHKHCDSIYHLCGHYTTKPGLTTTGSVYLGRWHRDSSTSGFYSTPQTHLWHPNILTGTCQSGKWNKKRVLRQWILTLQHKNVVETLEAFWYCLECSQQHKRSSLFPQSHAGSLFV